MQQSKRNRNHSLYNITYKITKSQDHIEHSLEILTILDKRKKFYVNGNLYMYREKLKNNIINQQTNLFADQKFKKFFYILETLLIKNHRTRSSTTEKPPAPSTKA